MAEGDAPTLSDGVPMPLPVGVGEGVVVSLQPTPAQGAAAGVGDADAVHQGHGAPVGDGAAPTYESVASSLGLTASDVRNYLHVARRRLEVLVRLTVNDYVAGNAELRDELAELFPR